MVSMVGPFLPDDGTVAGSVPSRLAASIFALRPWTTGLRSQESSDAFQTYSGAALHFRAAWPRPQTRTAVLLNTRPVGGSHGSRAGVLADESMADARPVTLLLYHDPRHPSVLYVPIGRTEAADEPVALPSSFPHGP